MSSWPDSIERDRYILYIINERWNISYTSLITDKVIDPFKDFYTPRDIEKWVSLTLTFYVKGHNKKQTKSCDPIRSLERSILHPSRPDKIMSLKI